MYSQNKFKASPVPVLLTFVFKYRVIHFLYAVFQGMAKSVAIREKFNRGLAQNRTVSLNVCIFVLF